MGFVEVRWVPLVSAELQIQPAGELLPLLFYLDLLASTNTKHGITVLPE